MNILFCSEGFIVDGVASFNLYLSAALSKFGANVAVVGRWGGGKGFQERHLDHGVQVLQRYSLGVYNARLLQDAVNFAPDIIITDARRSFPFAIRIKQATGAKIVTIFHDPPQSGRKGPRSVESLIEQSDYWLTSERPILDSLTVLKTQIPTLYLPRPVTEMVTPTPFSGRDPFKVLCFGRLSSWKSPAIKYLVKNAVKLRKQIPTLEIHVVGGGRRIVNFKLAACVANIKARSRFVRILGTKIDPNPSIQNATVVCAGATSAIEAILSNRPIIAVSGLWVGLITSDNLQLGLDSHFGERTGVDYNTRTKEFIYLDEQPELVGEALVQLYQGWNDQQMKKQTEFLRQQLYPKLDSQKIAKKFLDFISH